MSGPIVRKYGFPNFEKIFGERELKHGSENESEAPAAPEPPAETSRKTPESGTTRPDPGPSKP
jgi:hypothetical protein